MSNENIFSGTNNYRGSLVGTSADYYASLRDEALVNIGMLVTIKVPKQENNIDEYSDFVDIEDEDYLIKHTYIQPQIDKYIRTLSLLGQDMENEYPLTINILSREHMPRNTIIVMQEINSAYESVSREWRVLSTEIKQVGHIYTRLAYAVPARSYTSILGDVIFCETNASSLVTNVHIHKNIDNEIIINASNRLISDVISVNIYKSYGLIDSFTETKAVVYRPQILD